MVPSYVYKECKLKSGPYVLTIRVTPSRVYELRVGKTIPFSGVIGRLGAEVFRISILERGILNVAPKSDGAGWGLLSASDCSNFVPSSTTVAPLGAYYLVVNNVDTPSHVRYSAEINLSSP